ncbi:MAG: hydrogenase maturation protease [Flavobacterium sp.]|nr:hydrogenase maturation protease [Flavobacterium sp.]
MHEEIFPHKSDNFHTNGNEILILGIGNYLMGDEGVGVHFVNTIDESEFPQNITFMDGGTGGFLLIPYLESHRIAIIVDATMDGKETGTISLLKPKFSNDFPLSLSGHNFGLKDMVEILTMFDRMPDIYLYTITIDNMDPMVTELSPKVQASLALVKTKILDLLEELKTPKSNLIES